MDKDFNGIATTPDFNLYPDNSGVYNSTHDNINIMPITFSTPKNAYEFQCNLLLSNNSNEIIFEKLIRYSTQVIERYSPILEAAIKDPTSIKQDLVKIRTYYIYLLVCKFKPYKDLPYIGFTSNFYNRMRSRIRSSLYMHKKRKYHKRYITEAFIKAMSKEIGAIRKFVSNYYLISNLEDLYDYLDRNWKSFENKKILDFIYKNVIEKHFYIDKTFESYNKKKYTLKRERELTKKFVHFIGDNKVIGTVYPNGLNAQLGGTPGAMEKIWVPLYDIIGLTSLGLSELETGTVLEQYYKKEFRRWVISDRIIEFFGSFEELQDKVFKPVVENLIKDKANFYYKDIQKALNKGEEYLNNRLERWFAGNNFSDLKILVKSEITDWTNIGVHSPKTQQYLRGYPKNKWNSWIIDNTITTNEMAKIVGLSPRYLRDSEHFIKPISKILIGKEVSGWVELTRLLRKKIAERFLRERWDPLEIMKLKFRLKAPHTVEFYERLFKDENMSYEEIITAYSSNPDKFLKRLEEHRKAHLEKEDYKKIKQDVFNYMNMHPFAKPSKIVTKFKYYNPETVKCYVKKWKEKKKS